MVIRGRLGSISPLAFKAFMLSLALSCVCLVFTSPLQETTRRQDKKTGKLQDEKTTRTPGKKTTKQDDKTRRRQDDETSREDKIRQEKKPDQTRDKRQDRTRLVLTCLSRCSCLVLTCLYFVFVLLTAGGKPSRSWGELTPRGGGGRFRRRSWVGFWTHLGCQKGTKTEPKTTKN